MTTKFQKRVRARMAKTGESYQAAYQALHQKAEMPVVAADIITFVEHELGAQLFPVQRMVLKALYGIPLDDQNKFEVRTTLTEIQSFTEVSYLQYLYEEGRSSIAAVTPGGKAQEAVVVIGRRAGKTQLLSYILLYEAYRLLHLEDPHRRYGLVSSNSIGLRCIAINRDMAQFINHHLKSLLTRSSLKKRVAQSTIRGHRFQTKRDVEETGSYFTNPRARSSVDLQVSSATSKGLRGIGCLVVAFDELAHFSGGSAEDSYNAAAPAVAAFTPKNEEGLPDGPHEGLRVMFSSPNGPQGLFYNKFQEGHDLRQERVVALQIPTWEMNPTVSLDLLQDCKEQNELLFRQEYGAEFVDIPRSDLTSEQELFRKTLDTLASKCSFCNENPATKSVAIDELDMGSSLRQWCDSCVPKATRQFEKKGAKVEVRDSARAPLIRELQQQLR